MELLISNDDGIEATGIRVLADSMRGLGGVTIVANHTCNPQVCLLWLLSTAR